MICCLSPNGSVVHRGPEPPAQLVVGTVDGVTTLERQAPGPSWKVARHSLAGLHVGALLFEPGRDALFAATHGGGVHASADRGRTWEPRTRGLTIPHVWTLASVERNGAPVLYAGAEPARLFRSIDYGASWEELPALRSVPGTERWMFPPPPHVAHVKNIAFDPGDSRIMFVGVEQGALLKSSDDGQSWRELDEYARPDDVYEKDIHRLVICPSDPKRIYMTTGDGLYMSADGGETWEHLTTRAARIAYPDALLLSPFDDDVLFMAGGGADPPEWRRTGTADSGIVVSEDGGRTWRSPERGLPPRLHGNVDALSMHARPGGFTIFAGTTDGEIFASEDGGAGWALIASGLAPISSAGHYLSLR